jgi:hypothetical protein
VQFVHAARKADSHSAPDGEFVTAGAPSLMPLLCRGWIYCIQREAAEFVLSDVMKDCAVLTL